MSRFENTNEALVVIENCNLSQIAFVSEVERKFEICIYIEPQLVCQPAYTVHTNQLFIIASIDILAQVCNTPVALNEGLMDGPQGIIDVEDYHSEESETELYEEPPALNRRNALPFRIKTNSLFGKSSVRGSTQSTQSRLAPLRKTTGSVRELNDDSD